MNITLEEFKQVKDLHRLQSILKKYDTYLFHKELLGHNIQEESLEKQFQDFSGNLKLLEAIEETMRRREELAKNKKELELKPFNKELPVDDMNSANIDLKKQIDEELNSSLKTALRKVNGLTHK